MSLLNIEGYGSGLVVEAYHDSNEKTMLSLVYLLVPR